MTPFFNHTAGTLVDGVGKRSQIVERVVKRLKKTQDGIIERIALREDGFIHSSKLDGSILKQVLEGAGRIFAVSR